MDTNIGLNNLKRHVFFEFLNMVGRVFVHVRYSDAVVLGKRGFTAEEKEDGIILVFNSKMNFTWDDYGITVTLVFGTAPQKCFIPIDEIVAVYSPELNAQFVTAPLKGRQTRDERGVNAGDKGGEERETPASSENVIRVDFTRKEKK